jgi:hypothetical protein
VSSVFRVLEVFRPAHRKGPLLVGNAPSAKVTVGTLLALADNPALVLEVIAIDFPTLKSQAEGKLAIVVRPDPGDELRPGLMFNILNTDS